MQEATRAAEILGASFQCFDLGDYPLQIDAQALERLTMLIRELAPDVIITHTERDPFNPDHPLAYTAVQRASILASGSGVASGFPTIKPAELFLFEPHQPEHCGFVPTTFVDITAVFPLKQQAMAGHGRAKLPAPVPDGDREVPRQPCAPYFRAYRYSVRGSIPARDSPGSGHPLNRARLTG